MTISDTDKEAGLRVLATNPKATTTPMRYSEVLAQTGFSKNRLNSVKALREEGRIWEDESEETHHRLIYLVVTDKYQQVKDLIEDHARTTYYYWRLTATDFAKFCRMPFEQAVEICIRLQNEGFAVVESLKVQPSPTLIQSLGILPECPRIRRRLGDGIR